MSTRCHPCFATPVLGRLRAAFRAADAAGSAPLLFLLPEVQTYFDQLYLFRRSVRLIVFVNFAIIGMAYFLGLQVSFSIWFFHLLGRFQTGVFNLIGYIKGHNEALTGSSTALSQKGMDAGSGGDDAVDMPCPSATRGALRMVLQPRRRRTGRGDPDLPGGSMVVDRLYGIRLR
ncbi:MAG: DUF6785 family protein [Candidatus Latescibacterota bacterium]|jgi:hypothetical protein